MEESPGTGRSCAARPIPSAILAVASMAGALSALIPPALGDQVIVGGVTHTDVSIVSLDGGRLAVHGAGGKVESFWLCDVDRLTVDATGAFLDFNRAERFLADHDPANAMVRYRRSLRGVEGMWTDLIEARLVTACDRADRTDQAVLHLVHVALSRRTGPALAVRLIPKTVTSDQAQASTSVEHLDEALAANPPFETRLALRLCRYELLRNIGRPDTADAARTIAVLSVPEPLRCHRVYEILLPAMTQLVEDRAGTEALPGLDQAILHAPEDLLPGFLLLKGQALLRTASTREDYIRAAWPFMRVAIHMPRDPRAADGLRGAALAVERIGRADQAVELLTECLAHKRIEAHTRQLAEEALARLQPGVQEP